MRVSSSLGTCRACMSGKAVRVRVSPSPLGILWVSFVRHRRFCNTIARGPGFVYSRHEGKAFLHPTASCNARDAKDNPAAATGYVEDRKTDASGGRARLCEAQERPTLREMKHGSDGESGRVADGCHARSGGVQ